MLSNFSREMVTNQVRIGGELGTAKRPQEMLESYQLSESILLGIRFESGGNAISNVSDGCTKNFSFGPPYPSSTGHL